METLDELYDIIAEMNKGEPADVLDRILKISNSSARRLFQIITGEKEYIILKETVYAMQSATIYYFTKALEKQAQGDDVSYLAYSAYAAGINAVLVTTFLPILRKHAAQYHNDEEVRNIQRINSHIEQEVENLTRRAMNAVSGKSEAEDEQKADETVKTMISLAVRVAPNVRSLAVTLAKRFPAGDFKQARRLYEYVRDEINYVHDPRGIEEVQPPETTLKLGGGDCDDKAVLLAALLISIGFETCFFVADTDNDKHPDHVYAGVYLPEAPELYKPFPHGSLLDGRSLHNWIPLDPTYEDSDFGVIPLTDIGISKYVPIREK